MYQNNSPLLAAARFVSLVCFFATWVSPVLAADESVAIEKAVDSLFSSVRNDTPGGTVLVAKDGKILFEKGYGLANVEAQLAFTSDTRFRIGSLSKQFTAAAILKLQEEGKLNLQNTLSKYIPDWPRGNKVTLSHLLSHSSGIHDYTKKGDFAPNITKPIDLADLVVSFKNDPYNFDPGKKYSYDNSGYVLLAYIIEKVSGVSYDAYLRSSFFLPLGMNNTGVALADRPGKDEALGYSYNDGAIHRSIDWNLTKVMGAGSLYSTARDLFIWNEALFGGKLLSASSLSAAFTVARLDLDDPTHPEDTGYGLGWSIDRLDGEREISHGGELAGFGSYLLRLPARRITVVVLLNCVPQMPSLHQWNLARAIAHQTLGERSQRDSASIDPVKISPSDIALIDGRYEMGSQTILTVMHEDSRVFFRINEGPKTEIFPRSDRIFAVRGGAAEAAFVRNKEGHVVKAILKQAGERIDAPKLE